MSLISDTGYLVHNLRLSYLRHVDDPAGGRIISFNTSYVSNPYIRTASMHDPQRWPELEYPSSPQASDDEDEGPAKRAPQRNARFGGATGLRHTQTIMGRRSGGMGMNVNANRTSTSKRASRILAAQQAQADVEDDSSSQAPTARPSIDDSQQRPINGNAESASQTAAGNASTTGEQAPAPPPRPVQVQFIPKFKGAAEMERRRMARMRLRRGPIPVDDKPQVVVTGNLNPEDSSSSEEPEVMSSSDSIDSDFDIVNPPENGMDDGDEFDPDFAATRTPGGLSDTASDMGSLLSGTAPATSPSIPPDSPHTHRRTRSRLSPVSESSAPNGRPNREEGTSPSSDYFEVVRPPNTRPDPAIHVTAPSANRRTSSLRPRGVSILQGIGRPNGTVEGDEGSPSDLTFARRPVPSALSKKSALSAALVSSGGSTNPFSELYASISGRGETACMDVTVFFPHATKPAGRPMNLSVRKDATVEEAVGFALWNYWEEGWLPKLDEDLKDEDDSPYLKAMGWVMRIAEDDGEVDEDFPPPDRTGKISKFNMDAYAVLRATATQIRQNQELETMIARRPSRVIAAPRRPSENTAANVHPAPPGVGGGALTLPNFAGLGAISAHGSTPILSSSLGPSSSHGPQVFLRIQVAENADAAFRSTTIEVSAGMYMQESLELVCKRRELNPKDYALLLKDPVILIPLDRTVASLQGKRDLTLVKRSMLPSLGIEPESKTTRGIDPNASILKRASDVPEIQLSAMMDYTNAYKKYTIYRKMPMLARQERTLAIDGEYVHIMPSANNANKARVVFDSGKTISFHIKSIVECQQSTKSSVLFKIIIPRETRNKRYDFEADTPRLASEIVQTIRQLKTSLERAGANKSTRRSRHVV
ncbi:hypothetical protein CONPUDRAFT_109640 [Coniophora puteana RWD-64-598 SS2]|uniref:SIN1-domain-containing protein n=1 Tax=Coniophora puteana (strain RWD-64-598) TaxID=741705 RepID=A0A5M3MEA8_CONPW|nr:uncharacterized protein CONPUDRAFT_109640 [Coniophora puteana RWD-64-598 SS2]EIW77134.1 hypothetical protein CONPUDRAFT_109640 [Coniophora puteana RWD-64-598 SS2]